MTLLETLLGARDAADQPRAPVPPAVPQDIESRQRRGRIERDRNKVDRVLYWKFWQSHQYWWRIPGKNQLSYQTSGMTGVAASGKPGYRVRNTYNFIRSIVEAKVSAATQQVPGYEVTPSTDDPDIESASELSEQILIYGYDQWRVRRHTIKAVTTALVAGEAFVRPLFDPNIGPYVNGAPKGEIKLQNFSRDEVSWEPGVDFDDSRWHCIDQKYRVEDVKRWPGYIPGSLDDERNPPSLAVANGSSPADEIVVSEHLERPCPEYPEGRRIFTARNRIIVDYRLCPEGEASPNWWEPFPLVDADDTVLDEPALHRISYTVNPRNDPSDGMDDFGLVERIIDLQRTINDTWNKILEIKNRALLLQMWVPKNSQIPRRDDTPGATFEYNAAQDGKPVWEPAPDPGLIQQLLLIHQQAIEELRTLAADVDIQADPRVSGDAASAAIQSAQLRWQSFLGDLAEFHSRLGRHLLTLVARHYDEQRQVQIRGQYAWQSIQDFKGRDLQSQVNVRVSSGSLEAKSRQAIQAQIQFVQANWPGAISPEAALSAIQSGNMTGLIKSYENDLNRAWRVVKRLRTGDPETVFNSFTPRWDPTVPNLAPQPQVDPASGQLMSAPPPFDPTSGQMLPPTMGAWVPGYMPGPQDNIKIWRTVIGDYMKTLDFEQLNPPAQQNFYHVWDALDYSEQQRAAAQANQQMMQAQSLGMGNASKPQLAPPTPDVAGFTPENSSPVPAPA